MTKPNVSPLLALIIERIDVKRRSAQYRKWMAAQRFKRKPARREPAHSPLIVRVAPGIVAPH